MMEHQLSDSEITFKFSNKTDSGLTIGYVVELESDGDWTATLMKVHYLLQVDLVKLY